MIFLKEEDEKKGYKHKLLQINMIQTYGIRLSAAILGDNWIRLSLLAQEYNIKKPTNSQVYQMIADLHGEEIVDEMLQYINDETETDTDLKSLDKIVNVTKYYRDKVADNSGSEFDDGRAAKTIGIHATGDNVETARQVALDKIDTSRNVDLSTQNVGDDLENVDTQLTINTLKDKLKNLGVDNIDDVVSTISSQSGYAATKTAQSAIKVLDIINKNQDNEVVVDKAKSALNDILGGSLSIDGKVGASSEPDTTTSVDASAPSDNVQVSSIVLDGDENKMNDIKNRTDITNDDVDDEEDDDDIENDSSSIRDRTDITTDKSNK